MIKEQTRLGNHIFFFSLYRDTIKFQKNDCLKWEVFNIYIVVEDDIPNLKLINNREI